MTAPPLATDQTTADIEALIQALVAARPELVGRTHLSLQEIAAATGVSRAFLDDMVRTGQLRSTKIGSRRLVSIPAFCKAFG